MKINLRKKFSSALINPLVLRLFFATIEFVGVTLRLLGYDPIKKLNEPLTFLESPKKTIQSKYPDAFIQALKNGSPIDIHQALK